MNNMVEVSTAFGDMHFCDKIMLCCVALFLFSLFILLPAAAYIWTLIAKGYNHIDAGIFGFYALEVVVFNWYLFFKYKG